MKRTINVAAVTFVPDHDVKTSVFRDYDRLDVSSPGLLIFSWQQQERVIILNTNTVDSVVAHVEEEDE